MGQNYLTGVKSPIINAMLAATGWNLKKIMKKLKQELPWLYFFLEKIVENFNQQNNNHKKLPQATNLSAYY